MARYQTQACTEYVKTSSGIVSMKLGLVRSLWGVVKEFGGDRCLRDVLPEIRDEGYIGVECLVMTAWKINQDGKEFTTLLQEYNMAWVPMAVSSDSEHHVPGSPTASHSCPPEKHVLALEGQIQDALAIAGSAVKVLFINCQSGHDSMHMRGQADDMAKLLTLLPCKFPGVDIVHELHRRRIFYSPWATVLLARQHPSLRFTADFSHFTVVCEAEPGDPCLDEAVREIAPRVHHIHARIGCENSPQVNDPRAPEWGQHWEAYAGWWCEVWAHQRRSGNTHTTCTPEHGPATYQQAAPGTGEPLANIWEVNSWVGARVRELHALQGA